MISSLSVPLIPTYDILCEWIILYRKGTALLQTCVHTIFGYPYIGASVWKMDLQLVARTAIGAFATGPGGNIIGFQNDRGSQLAELAQGRIFDDANERGAEHKGTKR